MILNTMAKHSVIAKLVTTCSPYQMIGLDGTYWYDGRDVISNVDSASTECADYSSESIQADLGIYMYTLLLNSLFTVMFYTF